MKLHLIDDLPLFGVCDDMAGMERSLRHRIDSLTRTAPAQVSYIDFAGFRSLWEATAHGACATALVVGTRPRILAARFAHASRDCAVIAVHPKRRHGTHGETAAVEVEEDLQVLPLAGGPLTVLDDIMFSGKTAVSVLSSLPPASWRGPVSVRTVLATREAINFVKTACPQAQVVSQIVADYAPVTEGTAIFLWDLLFGTLGGRPFLSRTDLLAPFFGDDLAGLLGIRDDVDATSGWRVL
ncbi:hypothetical protein KDK95_06700 [Actinospica sp. MGRD01-02]|uniref:Phosphoribosyltransferase n=1 Tax=Actinospica acidithermotolerans TaxID=2828514 RepID=A0A941IIB7_9ACTN|nr:hypothetical protein [Actinospica acidithermotolerans]MBR7825988.1 hypothetical protein [Actinospica acidithermotolerans]